MDDQRRIWNALDKPVSEALEMWVIYKHPTDYPDKWVARRCLITNQARPTDMQVIGDSQKEVEDLIPAYCATFLPRFDGDEPQIVGAWV